MALPSAYGEESPEALRRRADALLDEMMLGGVDVASAGPPTANGASYWPPAAEAGREHNGASYGGNGASGSFDAHGTNSSFSLPDEPIGRSTPAVEQALPSSTDSRGHLVSAEERYAQYAGARPAAQSGTAQPDVYPWESTAGRPGTADVPLFTPTDASTLGSTAVRRQSPSAASTMAVGARAANRSNLLPRNNEIDVNTVQQEINDLLRAVGTSLPPGNEAVERSRHLLNKAQTLLRSDPTRTAEVDYYLQQVRRIVQRTRQTQEWSSIYRRRLTLYLWAWALLSSLILATSTVYAAPLADWCNQLLDLPDWWLIVQQVPVVLAGAFAGTLGASLSALLHMQRHGRREFGYFDRKYGLRGLLLPLLGLFWGLVLAGVWSAVYAVAGFDPVLYTWAVAAPAVLAFLVGFGQQYLYGAR